ncbi:neuronal acetylcholine receptor subunit alpha-5-like [Pecten maximus]|uniref:neuronal acetylcholine receptor subunit alpha-5-like n=1 Tax=Pecten maximus TaxID=6579 RepID=UPI0014584E15|nr:neuronal acetylcholine receptor subunit alpha-5-like [Pecten maximus]
MMLRGRLTIILYCILTAYIDIVEGQLGPQLPLSPPPIYSKELETQLRNYLFKDYNVLQRPNERVYINVSLSILTINDMSIKDQTLSMTGYLSLGWLDERLAWDSQTTTYSSIKFLFSTETYVWRPALLIDNAVHGISVISDVNTPMRIQDNGIITWSPADIYTVSCVSDIMYYPLDIQTCSLSLTSWAYTSNEISLNFDSEPVDLATYIPNGEWELLSTRGLTSGSRSKGNNSFSNVKFAIQLRRRPLFHVLNTLFPVALMAVLSAMVFKLPTESGEKIGFALTVLLAYAVYLTLISDNIPSTSVSVCYLSIYLSLILTYGTLSVLCTILVINIHSRTDEEEIPPRTRRVTKSILMPLAFWKGSCKQSSCCKKKVEPNDTRTIHVLSVSKINVNVATPATETEPIAPGYNVTSRESNADPLTWYIISKVLDAVFFNIFMLTIVFTSIVFFAILAGEYANV